MDITPERETAIRTAVKAASDKAQSDGKGTLVDAHDAVMRIADKLQEKGQPATHSGEIVALAIKSILADVK